MVLRSPATIWVYVDAFLFSLLPAVVLVSVLGWADRPFFLPVHDGHPPKAPSVQCKIFRCRDVTVPCCLRSLSGMLSCFSESRLCGTPTFFRRCNAERYRSKGCVQSRSSCNELGLSPVKLVGDTHTIQTFLECKILRFISLVVWVFGVLPYFFFFRFLSLF